MILLRNNRSKELRNHLLYHCEDKGNHQLYLRLVCPGLMLHLHPKSVFVLKKLRNIKIRIRFLCLTRDKVRNKCQLNLIIRKKLWIKFILWAWKTRREVGQGTGRRAILFRSIVGVVLGEWIHRWWYHTKARNSRKIFQYNSNHHSWSKHNRLIKFQNLWSSTDLSPILILLECPPPRSSALILELWMSDIMIRIWKMLVKRLSNRWRQREKHHKSLYKSQLICSKIWGR